MFVLFYFVINSFPHQYLISVKNFDHDIAVILVNIYDNEMILIILMLLSFCLGSVNWLFSIIHRFFCTFLRFFFLIHFSYFSLLSFFLYLMLNFAKGWMNLSLLFLVFSFWLLDSLPNEFIRIDCNFLFRLLPRKNDNVFFGRSKNSVI